MKARNNLYKKYHSLPKKARIILRDETLRKVHQSVNKAKWYNWLYSSSQPNIFEKKIINYVFGEKIYK